MKETAERQEKDRGLVYCSIPSNHSTETPSIFEYIGSS